MCACVSFVFAGGNDELADGNDESSGRYDGSPGGNDELADGNDESSGRNDVSSLRFIASFEPSIGSVM